MWASARDAEAKALLRAALWSPLLVFGRCSVTGYRGILMFCAHPSVVPGETLSRGEKGESHGGQTHRELGCR